MKKILNPKNKLSTVALIIAFAVLLVIYIFVNIKHHTVIRMALNTHWLTLHPGLQHTLAGDLVLSNQFDALVGMNDHGVVVPLSAKSWQINHEATLFTFKIDTNRKYSDGSTLKAIDFKNSWEESLALEPMSANSSLLDVLYKVEGFSNFGKTKTLSGLIAPDDETLIVKFTTPFRMALDHLQGNRFAAFKTVNGEYIGTGKYIISKISEDKLRFTPAAPNTADLSIIELEYFIQSEIENKLSLGEIDVLPYGQGSMISSELLNDTNIELIAGQDAVHATIALDVLNGSLFHKKEYRQAFQSLLFKQLKQSSDLANPAYFDLDFQIYLESQMGRISQNEVRDIILLGQKYESDLKLATKKHPLKLLISDTSGKFNRLFESIGLTIAAEPKPVELKTFFNLMYKKPDIDLMVLSFSIANGDPDGIYHRLGKQGAILSPFSFSDSVGDLLEEGRKIYAYESINSHYQKVAREVLKEVPLIHLGFSKAVSLIRKDRVTVNKKVLRRNQGHFDIFERH